MIVALTRYDIMCDAPGCDAEVTGGMEEPRAQVRLRAKAQGWRIGAARHPNLAICPAHRAEARVRGEMARRSAR